MILSPNEELWDKWDNDSIVRELMKCSKSQHYFIANYIKIFSNDELGWIPFTLWDTDVSPYDNQVDIIRKYNANSKISALKARQLGLTWLFLALFLHAMLYQPNSFVLLLSRGQTESMELLVRLRGMYDKLPDWMRTRESPVSSKTEWALSNGSNARALSTRKGDSYTASHVLVDEADLIHESGIDLRQVLLKVEPVIGQKGKLVLLSKSDKRHPDSTFKNIYRAAVKGDSSYVSIFCPYNVHPTRTKEWREQQIKDVMSQDGTIDSVWENYPATPEEAMAPNQTGKRFRAKWLMRCRTGANPIVDLDEKHDVLDYPFYTGVDIKHFRVYEEPDPRESYVIGVDPSGGAATSDPAPICVMKVSTMEDVAIFHGIAEPAVLGSHCKKISEYYNDAVVLSELNNHGHSFIMWMQENAPKVRLIKGYSRKSSDRKIGWEQSKVMKVLMCDTTARLLMNGTCKINDEKIETELASIEEATLKAPRGMHEDCAVSYMLCLCAIELCMNVSMKIEFVTIP